MAPAATSFDTSGTYFINTDFSNKWTDVTGGFANGNSLTTNTSIAVGANSVLGSNFSVVDSSGVVGTLKTIPSNTNYLKSFTTNSATSGAIGNTVVPMGSGTLDQIQLYDGDGVPISYVYNNLTKYVYLTIQISDVNSSSVTTGNISNFKNSYTNYNKTIIQLSTTYINNGVVTYGGNIEIGDSSYPPIMYEVDTTNTAGNVSSNLTDVSTYYVSNFSQYTKPSVDNGISGIYILNTSKTVKTIGSSFQTYQGSISLVQSTSGDNPYDGSNTTATFSDGTYYGSDYYNPSGRNTWGNYYSTVTTTPPDSSNAPNSTYLPMLGTVTFNR